MNAFAFSLVAAALVLPLGFYEPVTYVAAVIRLWHWFAYAAMGWSAVIIFLLRRIQELRLKAPGARTQVRARQ